MKQIVAIFLLLALNLMPVLVKADALQRAVQKIESDWAQIHYNVAKEQREAAYKQLLVQVDALNAQYPDRAELIIQQAIIVASNADNISALSALEAINQARELLLHAIKLNPNASEGAAYVTLGSLYYMVPGWPIAYGDNDKARELLKKALIINPNTIDANYFYGDFLVSQGQKNEALPYFKRAIAIPVRANQIFADSQLQAQAQQAILDNGRVVADNKQNISVALEQK